MGKIHKLSESVISKIAAGEVIGRPAYAIKELVENAIDAKATQIRIDLEQSGLQKIVVTDNGTGMSREDLSICFKPHTTSKLLDEDGLIGITSMGFRGEALSSIASISNMILRSKREEDIAGTEIVISAGEIETISPIGIPTGTQITIEQLFYPVPVRKKFLKSIQTELRLCIQLVTASALAYPSIRFIISHNNKIIFDLPTTKNSRERVSLLLGDHIGKNLIPIHYENSYFRVTGFLVKPTVTTSTQNKQFIFVNQRTVDDKLISLAVREAYGPMIEKGTLPIFILFISLPFETVDVNVHPRKETVTFIDKLFIFESIRTAFKEAFEKNNITFTNISWKDEEMRSLLPTREGDTKSYAGNSLKEKVLSTDIIRLTKTQNNKDVIQFHNLYLAYQTTKGVMYIDQHAAHERILYEEFKKSFLNEQAIGRSVLLDKPLEFLVSLNEGLVLEEYADMFKQLGFSMKKINVTKFLILKIPELFQERNIYVFLKELLEDVSLEKPSSDIDKKSHRMLAYLSCRAAVKAGDALTVNEAKNLLDLFENTDNNSTCPHGRPTTYHILLKELDKKFKR